MSYDGFALLFGLFRPHDFPALMSHAILSNLMHFFTIPSQQVHTCMLALLCYAMLYYLA